MRLANKDDSNFRVGYLTFEKVFKYLRVNMNTQKVVG